MVLGSPLQGSPTANGSLSSQQGSKLSQMKDSFQKQMQRDKEKARFTTAAPRVTPTQKTANGSAVAAPRSATNGGTARPLNSTAAPKTTSRVSEVSLRQTQSPPSNSTALRSKPSSEDTSPKKSPAATPVKISQANSTSARPRPTATKSPSTMSASASRAPTASKRAPPASSGANSDLPQCKNCGRHFAADRLALHESICLKTSKKKRKVFDPTKMRVKGTEAESYLRHPAAKAKVVQPPKSDWRRKHEDFIRSIRDAKAAQAHVAAGGKLSDLPPPPPMDTSHLIPCPHCGRKFNDAAAERHIPRCKDIINKPKPPPSRGGPSGAIPKGRGRAQR
ncbi:zinc finger C2HC domain-containing protein 1C-like [Ischnura elegans]|uniref:zinc finger C2HC domain-containing protein 1C-like n=1 Tax=Ischnura elegans TaxID=197161 RepID=UPI001ED8A90B|nr:zinc finger C2HC domain-containing protein 1C-like [Ischnura elegans]